MKAINKMNFSLVLMVAFSQQLTAQYTVNGNAQQVSCNQYRLTQEATFLSGSVWNNIKIDLTNSFDFKFDVFLGNNNIAGADGIAFVLQPISTSVGSAGGGLGYQGITPAVGITLDTYQNAVDNDPTYDHIAIQLNGNLNHTSINNIAGPVQAINGNDNIEDGQWHALRIVWDATAKTLTAYVDGVQRVSAVKDIVTDILSGNPMVYWGFTGSTGGEINLQQFKTALNPKFYFAPGQKRCINEPIAFFDSTISFTVIAKFYWDFGDGSPIDSVNLNPIHTYTIEADYTVIQRVIGADGCEATNTQLVRIGSKPVALFGYSGPLCDNVPVQFSDSSGIGGRTVTQWSWIHNGTVFSNQQNPVQLFPAGIQTVGLVASNITGCISDTVFKTFTINPRPVVNMIFSNACKGAPVDFTGIDNNGTGIVEWTWNYGDGSTGSGVVSQHTYSTEGMYTVSLVAISSNGCLSGTINKNIIIYSTKVFAGNDTIAATGQPVQLQATGAINYEWTPATGLNNSVVANPVAVLNSTQTYTVKGFTPQGCESYDDITVKIYQGPDIYLPNAFSPNGDGLNDLYRGIPVGLKQFQFLSIFNRYGEQLFYTTDYKNGWDGFWKGQKQSPGVYVVIAAGTGFRGNNINKKQSFILIR